MEIDTETAQNSLARILNEIHLDISDASVKIKRQYMKSKEAIFRAYGEVQILNSLKDERKINNAKTYT